MASVYETVVKRMESFPGLYKSRTDVLLDALVSGKASWRWVNGEAVWDCPSEVVPTVEETVVSVRNCLMSTLVLMPDIPESSVDVVVERVRGRFTAAQEMAPFIAQMTNLETKSPYKESTFAQSLFNNLPEDITEDWQEAVNEVKLVLDAEGHI